MMISQEDTASHFDDIGFYPITDPWLQNLLWTRCDPLNHFQSKEMTKVDMMNTWSNQYFNQKMLFWGSKKAGMIFRLYFPNEYVVEPHVVGDVTHLRELFKIGIDFLFGSTKVTKVNIYTHILTIRNIFKRFGFTQEGHITQSFLVGDELMDFYILGLAKNDYVKQ